MKAITFLEIFFLSCLGFLYLCLIVYGVWGLTRSRRNRKKREKFLRGILEPIDALLIPNCQPYSKDDIKGADDTKNNGKPIAQVVRFIAYDYLIATNKQTSGIQYQQLKDGLSRLKGTVIKTNIKTNGKEATREFSLIDEWCIFWPNLNTHSGSI